MTGKVTLDQVRELAALIAYAEMAHGGVACWHMVDYLGYRTRRRHPITWCGPVINMSYTGS